MSISHTVESPFSARETAFSCCVIGAESITIEQLSARLDISCLRNLAYRRVVPADAQVRPPDDDHPRRRGRIARAALPPVRTDPGRPVPAVGSFARPPWRGTTLRRKSSADAASAAPAEGIDRPRSARHGFSRDWPFHEKRKQSISHTVESSIPAREISFSDHGAGSSRGGARRPRRVAEIATMRRNTSGLRRIQFPEERTSSSITRRACCSRS